MQLPSPNQIRFEFPLSDAARHFLVLARRSAIQILNRTDPRLAAIVGPCSIHDSEASIEYALRLKNLKAKNFFPIMRFFVEKPRTRTGWKGMLYDPHLDGSYDIAEGLRKSRRLLVQLAEMGIPVAMEFLEPILVPYFEDLITWGLIGARTSASQPHRQIVSTLSFPVGFKNSCSGEIESAIHSIISSRMSHSYIGIDEEGRAAALKSSGNPHSHLVLRGSEMAPNFDPLSIKAATLALQAHRLEPRIMIDCSHGNSGKDPSKQQIVLESILEQKNNNLAGFMLESHLYGGKQPLCEDPSLLNYGISITDSCLGWDETEYLLNSFA